MSAPGLIAATIIAMVAGAIWMVVGVLEDQLAEREPVSPMPEFVIIRPIDYRQCAGSTKMKGRCKKAAQTGSEYCGQHPAKEVSPVDRG